MAREFDAIIIGAGQAGPPLAGRLTQAGWSVALIERKLIGGTCVNVGCTPTKAMIASAHAAHIGRRSADFGVSTGNISVDMKKVKARKDAIVTKSRTGLEEWLGGMERCAVFHGAARFLSAQEVQVGEETLHAPHIFLNVGARPVVPDMPGVDSVPFLTSTTVLDLDEVPKHLIIVGAGYVGLEFAQMFRRFGAAVTVIDKKKHSGAHDDEDIAQAVREILEKEGVQTRMSSTCTHLKKQDEQVAVELDCEDGANEVLGSHILLATGRRPNTDDLNLAAAGVKVDERGFVVTDEQLRTNVEGIWAMGDCNGRGAFTHTSYNDFEIVAANLLDNDPRKVSDRIPVHALYIDPPLAQIGQTETQVRESGRKALIGIRPMTRVSRAVEKGESQGFMKVLVDAETEEILGASILGVGGDEAIHCIITAMMAKQPASLLRHSVHIHPTVAELIPTVFGELKPLN
jgi:pyruvate/2-oxoglutarate dehydrogenase complex dihydrolipoamide dehydrogenase (E3) component